MYLKSILSALAIIFCGAAHATLLDDDFSSYRVATSNPAFLQFEMYMDRTNAPIQSRADLDKHLEDKDSPLYELSDGGRQLFLDSLTFGESGVGSFRTVELEAELTPTQILEVLKLFGFQKAISGFQNARVETERDLELLNLDKSNEANFVPPCGSYVEGYCVHRGTCQIASGYCCDPPTCES